MTVHAKPGLAQEAAALLAKLGVHLAPGDLVTRSPITGEEIARLAVWGPAEVGAAVERAHEAFLVWRKVPAPRRGELVRLLGEELRAAKADLAMLVTLEAARRPPKASAKCRR